jgi:hypothetical protein
MLRCVLFIPPGRAANQIRDICAAYAHDHRYLIVGIATTWAGMAAMLIAGEAAVGIVADRDQLPADRTPRVEVVNDAPTTTAPTPTSRRPKRRDRAAR